MRNMTDSPDFQKVHFFHKNDFSTLTLNAVFTPQIWKRGEIKKHVFLIFRSSITYPKIKMIGGGHLKYSPCKMNIWTRRTFVTTKLSNKLPIATSNFLFCIQACDVSISSTFYFTSFISITSSTRLKRKHVRLLDSVTILLRVQNWRVPSWTCVPKLLNGIVCTSPLCRPLSLYRKLFKVKCAPAVLDSHRATTFGSLARTDRFIPNGAARRAFPITTGTLSRTWVERDRGGGEDGGGIKFAAVKGVRGAN